jgi:hypothetical protein
MTENNLNDIFKSQDLIGLLKESQMPSQLSQSVRNIYSYYILFTLRSIENVQGSGLEA